MRPEDGETVEGWGEAEMKTLKTFIRTKSGRLVEKTILISTEDYDSLQKIKAAGGDPSELLGRYMTMEEGSTVEAWAKKESKPMNVSGALVSRPFFVILLRLRVRLFTNSVTGVINDRSYSNPVRPKCKYMYIPSNLHP